MPRGTRRTLHYGPGIPCGIGGGFIVTDWARVTCAACLAIKPCCVGDDYCDLASSPVAEPVTA